MTWSLRSLPIHIWTGVIWGMGTLLAQIALLIAVSSIGVASPDWLWPTAPVVVAAALATGFGGWFISTQAFAPLRDAVTEVDSFDDHHPETRLPVPYPDDERRAVIATINSLLERLHMGFADGSRFAANASHELRTPLAVSRTILQVALKTPRDEETTRVLERLLQVNGRMIGITTALLELASAENELVTEDVELRVLVADTISLLEPEISERRLRLHLRLDDVRVNGHRDLLRQLVANLVRNAIVHNDDRGMLAVTLHGGPNPTLAIENDGAQIDPESLALLTQPFARLESRTHRKAGSGLGLAIVSRIADAHHASLALTARPRGGLIVQVSFGGASGR